MKKIKHNKYFKLGLTAFIVVALSMIFKYLLYNSKNFFDVIGSFIGVFNPLIYGIIIAYLIWPIVKFLENKCIYSYYKKKEKQIKRSDRKRIRVLSLIIALSIVFVLLYAFFGTVVPELYRSIESIINQMPTYYNNVVEFANNILERTDIFDEKDVITLFYNYSSDVYSFVENTILPNAKDVVKNLSVGVINIVGTLFNLLLGIIIAVYLIGGKEKYIGQCKKILYSVLSVEKANNLMVDLRFIDKTFGGFLVGKIIDSIIIGILCFIGLAIIGTPYPVLISVIVGVTNVIPFFGPYLGAIPSVILILLVSPIHALYFTIFVLILQQLDGNVIGPAILGNSIGVSSFWIIVSILIFGGFFGVWGMLVGVPCFACAYAFIRRRVNTRLIDKKMTILTDSYSRLEYIDDHNDFIYFDENHRNPESKRYIELTPNEHVISKEQTIIDKIKSFMNKLIANICSIVKKDK